MIAVIVTLLIISIVINFVFVLESPRFIAVAKGQFFKSRLILEKIAKINKKPVFCDTLEGEKVIGYTENNSTFLSADFHESSSADTTKDKSKIKVHNFKSGPK